MKERVVTAMSGGVDSSVAAALLQSQGYEVIGITMCFNLADSVSKKPRCCGLQGIEDAMRVAHKLGIKHYVLNMQKVLEEKVIKNFCLEYSKGRTPNPCVRCNEYIKFDALLKKAFSLGAKYLATGHYSRIEKSKNGYLLKKAVDLNKDQSYFLYRIGQKQLRHMLLPLGDYTKLRVRELARQFALPVAQKQESQEICFIPGLNYREFLLHRLERIGKDKISAGLKAGPIADKTGVCVGRHKGIAFYTIGQRKGLGIALGNPVYITKIDAGTNTITVGTRPDTLSKVFLVKQKHFILSSIKKKVAVKVKIRYNHKEAEAEVRPDKDYLKVEFKTPQFAVTPGQAAVFYKKDTVLGGGVIDRVREYKDYGEFREKD